MNNPYSIVARRPAIAKGMGAELVRELWYDTYAVLDRYSEAYGGYKYVTRRDLVNGLASEGWGLPEGVNGEAAIVAYVEDLIGENLSAYPICLNK